MSRAAVLVVASIGMAGLALLIGRWAGPTMPPVPTPLILPPHLLTPPATATAGSSGPLVVILATAVPTPVRTPRPTITPLPTPPTCKTPVPGRWCERNPTPTIAPTPEGEALCADDLPWDGRRCRWPMPTATPRDVPTSAAATPERGDEMTIQLTPAELDAMTRTRPPIPTVVVLCGSTRFKQAFIDANFRETMAGNIVLSVGWFSHADGHVYAPTEKEKQAFDELHLRKIDLADEVLILNVGGYVGFSTQRELDYARSQGKRIRFLEHK